VHATGSALYLVYKESEESGGETKFPATWRKLKRKPQSVFTRTPVVKLNNSMRIIYIIGNMGVLPLRMIPTAANGNDDDGSRPPKPVARHLYTIGGSTAAPASLACIMLHW